MLSDGLDLLDDVRLLDSQEAFEDFCCLIDQVRECVLVLAGRSHVQCHFYQLRAVLAPCRRVEPGQAVCVLLLSDVGLGSAEVDVDLVDSPFHEAHVAQWRVVTTVQVRALERDVYQLGHAPPLRDPQVLHEELLVLIEDGLFETSEDRADGYVEVAQCLPVGRDDDFDRVPVGECNLADSVLLLPSSVCDHRGNVPSGGWSGRPTECGHRRG